MSIFEAIKRNQRGLSNRVGEMQGPAPVLVTNGHGKAAEHLRYVPVETVEKIYKSLGTAVQVNDGYIVTLTAEARV